MGALGGQRLRLTAIFRVKPVLLGRPWGRCNVYGGTPTGHRWDFRKLYLHQEPCLSMHNPTPTSPPLLVDVGGSAGNERGRVGLRSSGTSPALDLPAMFPVWTLTRPDTKHPEQGPSSAPHQRDEGSNGPFQTWAAENQSAHMQRQKTDIWPASSIPVWPQPPRASLTSRRACHDDCRTGVDVSVR